MKKYYREDLAFIHDVGFGDFALNAAPGILEILEKNGTHDGLVTDLGCGSGLWAKELIKAGYKVLGIDISEEMIRIARKRAPAAEFRVGSLLKADLPPCAAVTSLGECFNYLFDSANDAQMLRRLFGRVYDALDAGGLFIFDIAEPGQVDEAAVIKSFSEGKGWVVLVEKTEQQSVLTRRIITFRKAGKDYRRADEAHIQRLYKAADIARELRQAGFRVRTTRSYGRFELPKARAAFIARKPLQPARQTL